MDDKEYRLRIAEIYQNARNKRHAWNKITTTIITIVISIMSYLSIASMSGKTTNLYFFVKLLANIKIRNIIWYIITFIIFIYALLERGLRRHNIKRLSRRIMILEQNINPYRGSSELNPDGTTRKEDKI